MIKKPVRVIYVFFLILGACTSQNEIPEYLPSPITTPSPTPSNTIVWFPPTRTASPIPLTLQLPTPDMRPGLDNILYEDSFSNSNEWQTFQNSMGSVAFGMNELTIAISKPKGSLQSFYSIPPPENFYWEITASPSLCRGADTYGLLSRATGNLDYFQFAISCEGLLRFDRIKDGKVSTVLQNWIPSGQVAPGSPLVLRLGIWTWGSETRFFINDVYQFGSHGLPRHIGQIGLFAHSGGKTALTVNFKDMVLRLVKDVPPSAVNSPTVSATNASSKKSPAPTLSTTPPIITIEP